jgi:hypothetical protein
MAEDASHEALLRLARYAPLADLTGPEAYFRYLRTLCANVAEEQKNTMMRQQTVIGSTLESDATDAHGPGRDEEADKPREWTPEALPRSDRRLAKMMLDGYTLGEIAAEMGVADAREALSQLRGRLRKLGGCS